MEYVLELLASPSAWMAMATLIIMEVVLGIDNLVFISILTNKLPEDQRPRARTIGISGAMIMRLMLLSLLFVLVHLTDPVIEAFDKSFSWRDLILIAGGLFLVWKATMEMHHHVDPDEEDPSAAKAGAMNFGFAIVQILILDVVFSIDSILTAVGMTDHLPIMVAAVVTSVLVMLLASGPLARFIEGNPTVVTLALGFLMMIGMILIADGFGAHVPKGYVYSAMAFSAAVEGLNLLMRRSRKKRKLAAVNSG